MGKAIGSRWEGVEDGTIAQSKPEKKRGREEGQELGGRGLGTGTSAPTQKNSSLQNRQEGQWQLEVRWRRGWKVVWIVGSIEAGSIR